MTADRAKKEAATFDKLAKLWTDKNPNPEPFPMRGESLGDYLARVRDLAVSQ